MAALRKRVSRPRIIVLDVRIIFDVCCPASTMAHTLEGRGGDQVLALPVTARAHCCSSLTAVSVIIAHEPQLQSV